MTEMFIGVMSGTSLDGVDVVVVSPPAKVIAAKIYSYPVDIYQDLLKLNEQLACVATLDMQIGKFYANCINQLLASENIDPKKIVAIGLHGQTIDHSPFGKTPYTVQIGNANQVAFLTGIKTVADFRTKDIVAGGQGAPLVPAFHQAIFGNKNQVVVNIGGIANLTYLPKIGSIIGFDTGTGNCLLDEWAQKHQNKPYDKNGEWAKQGTINQTLLNAMLGDDYFNKPYPKSTGREYFNLNWLNNFSLETVGPVDVQATLSELTAVTIVNDCLAFNPDELLICGGGVNNKNLINRMQNLCGKIPIKTNYGIDPETLEAMAFAWLAKQAVEGNFSNIPSVTGASKKLVLGVIYPP